MTAVFFVAFFILGAILASFTGLVAARLNTGQTIAHGRSRCDRCNRPLPSLSLIPILSYVVGRGRSRCCDARLSFMAPLSEVLLGILFVAAFWMNGLTLTLFFVLSSFSFLSVLISYDLSHQILPPLPLWSFVVVSALAGFSAAPTRVAFGDSVLVALLLAGFLVLLNVFSRGRLMGLADAPLTFGLALLTGPVAFSGFIFSFWIGAVVGIIVLAGRPAGSRMGIEVPFAPFLAAGFLLAYFTQWNPFALIAALL